MIYVILANGFEETEVVEPVDILRRGGCEVALVSLSGEKEVMGAHGITLKADTTVKEVNPSEMEMLILPGGEGHQLLDASNEVHNLINFALVNNIYIAAICAAPSILGKKQILSGKKTTCYPGFEKYCYGAELSSEKAVIDGKIITGKGPGAASDFGFAALSVLKGTNTAETLKRDMQYND